MFIPNWTARHSFGAGDLVTDADGRRGLVADATALYAVIHWEDGREEELDQNEPRVWVEARATEMDEEDDWLDMDVEEVRAGFDLWSKAATVPPRLPVALDITHAKIRGRAA